MSKEKVSDKKTKDSITVHSEDHTEPGDVAGEQNQGASAIKNEGKGASKSTSGSAKADEKEPKAPSGGSNHIPEPLKLTESNTQNIGGVKFAWAENNVSEQMLKTKAPFSEAKPAEEIHAEEQEPTEEEKRQYLAGEFDKEQEPMTLEELMEVAELLIDLVDAVNSTAVGAWVKEKPDQFQLPSTQRKRLAGFLAKVFYKYQVKMGPVAGLIIAAVLYFGLVWKAGWDIKKEKKIEEERKAIEEQKAKNRAKKEAFRNKINATLGVERLTLKTLSERMGMTEEAIKPELELMINIGTIKGDHSDLPVKYSIAE